MPKTKKKRKRTVFTEAQVSMIRTIIREEIASGYATVCPPGYQFVKVPDLVPSIASVFSIEDVIGESEIDKARKKLAAGIDLTPLKFQLPPGASYFGRDDDGKELRPGFTDAYLQRLNAGDEPNEAYVRTCNDFKLPLPDDTARSA